MTTKINVPLDQLQPGDTITFPNAKVTHATDIVRFTFPSGTNGVDGARWLEKIGVTATREVESEYNLTWDQAVVAMFRGNGSVVCEDGSFRARYRIRQGQLQAFLRGKWLNTVEVYASFYDDKFRIVGGKQNG